MRENKIAVPEMAVMCNIIDLNFQHINLMHYGKNYTLRQFESL